MDKKIVFGALIASVSYILGTAFQPPLEEIGEKLRSYWVRNSAMSIEVCAPLVSASRVLRAYKKDTGEDLLVEKEDIDEINVNTIKIINNTNSALTDVVISIVPLLSRGQGTPDYIYTAVATNSISARGDFDVDFPTGQATRVISTDKLASGDGLLLMDNLYGPLDQQVEFKSDEYTVRKTFPRGCRRYGRIESKLGAWHGIYKMDDGSCDANINDNGTSHSCTAAWSMPIEFTNLMHAGAVVEITQIVNDEVMIVVDSTSEIVDGSDPLLYEVKTETKYRRQDD